MASRNSLVSSIACGIFITGIAATIALGGSHNLNIFVVGMFLTFFALTFDHRFRLPRRMTARVCILSMLAILLCLFLIANFNGIIASVTLWIYVFLSLLALSLAEWITRRNRPQPYEQEYQVVQAETYREGGRQHRFPSDGHQGYEHPQAHYPQHMPPQQQ